MNVLYYSKYCKTCAKLMHKLQSNGFNLFDLFDQIVCVDNEYNDAYSQNLPKFVTCVPVISTPDYNVPLIDNTVFDWVDFKILQLIQQNNQQQKLQMQQNNQQTNQSPVQMQQQFTQQDTMMNLPNAHNNNYSGYNSNYTTSQTTMMNPKLPVNEQEIPIMESTNTQKTAKETLKDFENIQKQRALDDQMLFK